MVRGWKGDLEYDTLSKLHVNKPNVPIITKKPNKIVVVDLDGTIFDVRTRWKKSAEFARPPSPKFWNTFYSEVYMKYDKPIKNTIRTLYEINKLGLEIVYIGSRREPLYEYTYKQLLSHNFPKGKVILRQKNYPTYNFKIRALNRLKLNNNIILYICNKPIDIDISNEVKIRCFRVFPNQDWNSYVISQIAKICNPINN